MMRKFFTLILVSFMLVLSAYSGSVNAADYGKKLTLSERTRLCNELKSARQQRSTPKKDTGVGGGIIPDSALLSIYNTTQKISDAMSIVLVLGHALTCNAIHANKNSVNIAGVTLFSYPNIPVWLCGAIIYFMGFMMTLSITFYLVDISFKLGFAVIMLPIGVALWPFPPTKDKLPMLIGIMLKSAAIFVFLAMTVSYALNLLDQATGGLEDIFERINNNETDTVSEDFGLASSYFIIIMFALIYGMKLIGSAVEDYAGKFFKDKAFGGGKKASPMHTSLTQAMDFAKKKTVEPAVTWAHDVARTQAGRITAGAGRVLSGKAFEDFQGKSLGEAAKMVTNRAGNAAARGYSNIAHSASKVATGTIGRLALGRNASENLQETIDQKIDAGASKIKDKASQFEDNLQNSLDQDNNNNADAENSADNSTKPGSNAAKKVAKATYKATLGQLGNFMENVGENMQRNKQRPRNMFNNARQKREAEEQQLEQQERDGKFTDN